MALRRLDVRAEWEPSLEDDPWGVASPRPVKPPLRGRPPWRCCRCMSCPQAQCYVSQVWRNLTPDNCCHVQHVRLQAALKSRCRCCKLMQYFRLWQLGMA